MREVIQDPARPVTGLIGSRSARFALLVILLVSTILRIQLARQGGQAYWPDELRYEGARQAVNALLGGDSHTVAQRLLSSSGHIFFGFIGVIPALLEHALFSPTAIPPGFGAAFFGLFSVGAIAAVWLIARQETADEPTATWCAFFYAGCVTAFFFNRHYFPYDPAICLLLLGWWQGLRSRTARGHWFTGILIGVGYLTYNAYWNLGAVILVFHVLRQRPSFRTAVWRAGWAALGLVSPLVGVVALARSCGFDLIANAREFSQTVTQGGFGGAWRYIPSYLATAEGGYGALLVILAAGGFIARGRINRWPGGIWLLMGGALAAEMIFFSDVIPRFALSGRFVKPLAIFLALAAGAAAGQGGLHRRRLLGPGLVLLAAGLAAANFRIPLSLQFPQDFRLRAVSVIDAERRHDPDAALQMYYADFMHGAQFISRIPPHTVLLRRMHPLQYGPYQFEGFDRATREAFQSHDFAMRLVRLQETPPALADDSLVGSDMRRFAGAIELQLDLPFPRPVGHTEPLVAAGIPGRGDLFSIRYLDAERIQIVADHWGWGAPVSAPFPVSSTPAGHHVILTAGSMIPPDSDPVMTDDPALRTLTGEVVVEWDGRVVMREAMPLYPSGVRSTMVGANYIGSTTAEIEFSGKIRRIRRVDPRLLMHRDWGVDAPHRSLSVRSGYPGPLVLHFNWPEAAASLPPAETVVLATTRQGQRLTLTARPVGSAVSFSLWADDRLLGESGPFLMQPGAHEMEIWSPDLARPNPESLPAMEQTLPKWMRENFLLALDDRLLLHTPLPRHHPDPASLESDIFPPPFSIGRPWPAEADASAAPFPGKIESIESLPLTGPILLRTLLRERYQGTAFDPEAPGPLRMKVRFAAGRVGTAEPLLAAGGTGIADLLIIVYDDDGRIRIGHDHWGSALLLSAPLDLDRTKEHVVDISMGCLYPPTNSPWARSPGTETSRMGQLYVAIDGQTVLTGNREFYTTPPSSLVIGRNLVGASTCALEFTGTVGALSRVDPVTDLPDAARLAAP